MKIKMKMKMKGKKGTRGDIAVWEKKDEAGGRGSLVEQSLNIDSI